MIQLIKLFKIINLMLHLLSPSLIITLTTTLTFIFGLLPFIFPSIFCFLLTLCLSLTLSDIIPQFNHMRQNQLFKCYITTYIFGIINGYYFTLGYWDAFGVLMCINTLRYYGEFQLVNNFHHHQLQWESFLIYHSNMYMITNVVMLVQHVVARYVFHFQYKQYHVLMIPAFIVTLAAMLIRIIAFFTAKSNFTHQVSRKKKPTHQLVTHGIYSILRHPSYTGFFYFTVASMVLIGNWVCAILFGLMLSVFFDQRISYEQYYLLNFFGDKYDMYRKKTHVFIPYLPQKLRQMISKAYD